MTVTNQNLIHMEIKSRLNSYSACYHLIRPFLSSLLLSKNVKINLHKIIMLPVVLYGCETCSVTLKEEHQLKEFENRAEENIWTEEG
jgi:hypothetical protein